MTVHVNTMNMAKMKIYWHLSYEFLTCLS